MAKIPRCSVDGPGFAGLLIKAESELKDKCYSSTSTRPREVRLHLWSKIMPSAGILNPFDVTPETIVTGAAALRAGSLGTAGPPGAATLAGATGPGVAGGGPAGRPHPGGPTFGTAAAMLLHDAARLLSRSRGIIQCVSTSVHHTTGSPSASVW